MMNYDNPKPDLAVEEDGEGVYVRVDERHYSNANKAPVRIPNGLLQKIIMLFKERGYDVSDMALRHNYNAWRCDMKSGYRDEERGMFLFTPCGCNPLCFHASRIMEARTGWQQTYEC